MTPSVRCQKKTIISTHPRLPLDLVKRFIVLAGLLACSLNSLQGQSDALFINNKGNLGVGTANRKANSRYTLKTTTFSQIRSLPTLSRAPLLDHGEGLFAL